MKIYAVSIKEELSPCLYERFISSVDHRKRERIKAFKRDVDRKRSLVGDVLIRSMVSDGVIPNEMLKYEYNDHGKPRFVDMENSHFNLSHAGEWVVAVVDSSPVGIDIEQMSDVDYEGIARSFFHRDEVRWLLTQDTFLKREAFYILWTLKESFIKAIGKGLFIPLDSFSVEVDRLRHVSFNGEAHTIKPTFFTTMRWEEDYVLSVASDTQAGPVCVVTYDHIAHKIRTRASAQRTFI
ncbi:4'-phosphopantetheinyl transferase superfamily protein [Rossellomorea marisflavi]|uniref:4'-phosphopantetheinyl transferase family protein n=1 Tax=Rossellomorea marisflavi TaxID=189381 RepID=UPI00345B0658